MQRNARDTKCVPSASSHDLSHWAPYGTPITFWSDHDPNPELYVIA